MVRKEKKKLQITVGIPAFKAQNHIEDCLSSINIQTVRDMIEVVIASDNPEDNYDYLIEKFPKLTIKTIKCEKNTGPGLARQRALDNATTNWITFIDADDVFMTPFSLEQLIGIIPQISFNEFFDKVKNDKYDSENELKEIRSKFSKEILDNDKKCGVAIW